MPSTSLTRTIQPVEKLREYLAPVATEVTHDRRKFKDYGFDEIPSEAELIKACPACDETGWYSVRFAEGAMDSGRCRHYSACLSLLVENELMKVAA